MPSRKRAEPPPKSRKKTLLYKVVELSNVDESALERTVNDYVRHGWDFDGVQFAMRESSKRPAMGFVFFTRKADAAQQENHTYREPAEAERHLRRVILGDEGKQKSGADAWARLKALAEEDEP